MLRAVIKLVRGQRLPRFRRYVVDELVAHAFRRTGRGRLSGRRSRLVPGLAAIVRALDQLPKPAAGLRRVQPVRIHGRSLHVIHLPARKMGAAYVPFFPLAIGRQNKCSLTRSHQNSHAAHRFLSWLKFVTSLIDRLRFSQALL